MTRERLENFHLDAKDEPNFDLIPLGEPQPLAKRKRVDSDAEQGLRHQHPYNRSPSMTPQKIVDIPCLSPRQNKKQCHFPAALSEPGFRPARYALQHVCMIVTVLLDEKSISIPHLISAYECHTFLKFVVAIKKAYASNWSRLPSTTSTQIVKVSLPGQPSQFLDIDCPRVYSNWYRQLRLYFAGSDTKHYWPEVFVLLQSEGGSGNCFFTDGDVELNLDLLAADRILGIGRKDISDSAVTVSKDYLERLEREVDQLREENDDLKTVLERNHIAFQGERKQVGGLRLRSRMPLMTFKDNIGEEDFAQNHDL